MARPIENQKRKLTTGIFEKKKILIVDDEDDILKVLEKRLRDAGYDTLTVNNGTRALEILGSENPDLVILDISMPGMDGFEVCNRIKNLEDMADIPIVFLTAKDSVDDKVKGLKAGVFDYITKPIDHRELLARIEALLNIRERYQKRFLRDELTGLCNYNFFQEQFTYYFELAKRYGRFFSLLIADIDNFKTINDEFGHLFGNLVLKRISEALQKELRKADIITRYGGDEFAIILPETNAAQGKLLLNRIKQDIGEITYIYGGKEIKVSLTFGFSAFSKEFNTKESLFEEADKDMYRHKSNKRLGGK